jgi:hypothetical protein
MATSFGRYNHYQANAEQNLKRLVTRNAKNVQMYGIPFTSMSLFVSSLKFAICNMIYIEVRIVVSCK